MGIPSLGLGFRSSRLKQLKFYRVASLVICCVLSFVHRLWTVIKHENVIQAYDPYFNYHATKYLTEHGFYAFLNWFDPQSWYPLGRIAGGTLYPGIMVVAAAVHRCLHFLNIPISVANVCIYVAPFFSSMSTFFTYGLTKELADNGSGADASGAGLLAAAFLSINPGYILRTVAGNFDNEGLAIFLMLATFYCWIRAIKTGHAVWSVWCSLCYFAMAASWGGYIYVLDLLPLHILTNILIGRFNRKQYVSYCTFYVLSTLLSMQVPFIGFAPVTQTTHAPALFVFILVQIVAFQKAVKRYLRDDPTKYDTLHRTFWRIVVGIFTALSITSYILWRLNVFSNSHLLRFYALVNPMYARKNTPIHHSVSENQPSAWSSLYFDLQVLLIMFPVGIWVAFKSVTEARTFLIVFGCTTIFFAVTMVRLIMLLVPVMCISSAIGLSYFLKLFTNELNILAIFSRRHRRSLVYTLRKRRGNNQGAPQQSVHTNRREIASVAVIIVMYCLLTYNSHCYWVVKEAYSSTTITVGEYDDFREGYTWLRMNTPESSKVMAWWDYGYRMRVMANRTSIIDNNTWNYTHIGQVGKAFALGEPEAYRIAKKLDVDYVWVIFGGVLGYRSDDLNKFSWMLQLANSTSEHGLRVKESEYIKNYEIRVDKEVPLKMRQSLLYKLSYHRFAQVRTDPNFGFGYDRTRKQTIPGNYIRLTHFKEVYTSKNWLVRIYKVKKRSNRF